MTPPPQRRFASYAYGLESYLKNPEKRRARNCKSYMKDLERVLLTAQHEAAKVNKKSEAIDTDQSVTLMVTKVTIDTDRWQVRNRNVY